MFFLIESFINSNTTSGFGGASIQNDSSLFFQFCLISASCGLIQLGLINQMRRENKYECLENEKQAAPQLLDLLTEKCSLLNKRNEYKESYNQLFEEQLISNTCDHSLITQYVVDMSNIDDLLASINEKIRVEMDNLSSLPASVINDISEKIQLANTLLENHKSLKLAGSYIERRQEIQNKEKEVQLQEMRNQLAVGSNSFFSNSNDSEKPINSSNSWGLQ